MLKQMNVTYPSSTADFDKEFVRRLLASIFSKAELREYSVNSSLRYLNRPKLQLAKGTFHIFLHKILFHLLVWFLQPSTNTGSQTTKKERIYSEAMQSRNHREDVKNRSSQKTMVQKHKLRHK